MILNLKNLNLHVEYNKFKMDTLQSILKLVTSGCYMATVDLKDAYYSVPVAQEHRKYLRFIWRSKLYQYTCFPNGLSSAPRLFTKLMVTLQIGRIIIELPLPGKCRSILNLPPRRMSSLPTLKILEHLVKTQGRYPV